MEVMATKRQPLLRRNVISLIYLNSVINHVFDTLSELNSQSPINCYRGKRVRRCREEFPTKVTEVLDYHDRGVLVDIPGRIGQS